MSKPAKKVDLDIPILIAESSYADLESLKRSFEHLFLRNITSTGRGLRTIELSERERFEIIFVSNPLVYLDGLSVIKSIREEGENISTPIVFVSEFIGDPAAEKASALGANRTICKPISQETLRSLLENILNILIITETEEKDRIHDTMREARVAVENGRKFRREGEFELAADAYRKAIAEVFCGLAEVYLSKGDKEGAEEVLKEAEVIDSEVKKNFKGREGSFIEQGKIWLQKKQYIGAKAEFQAALTLNENNMVALLGLGESLYSLDELGEGKKIFERAMESKSATEDSQIFQQIGMTACRGKHFDLAHDALERAIKKFPSEGRVYYCKAVVLVAEGELEPSLSYLSKALELEPEFTEAKNLDQKVRGWMRRVNEPEKEPDPEIKTLSDIGLT